MLSSSSLIFKGHLVQNKVVPIINLQFWYRVFPVLANTQSQARNQFHNPLYPSTQINCKRKIHF